MAVIRIYDDVGTEIDLGKYYEIARQQKKYPVHIRNQAHYGGVAFNENQLVLKLYEGWRIECTSTQKPQM
jgi:hypothetical protein